MGNSNLFSFGKLENKADVLKYALEFTAVDGKPNYKEAMKLYKFFIKTIDFPDVRDLWADVTKAIDGLKLTKDQDQK